ncbi:PQQ-dependent sugar dehydrogenase [Desulfosediminicola sp.]|uniref:PQQ-dependent sugar dehydrogenase n=1 Tax=Desulfosediminicola sp. TaxID=2886825 RepID=UPI003AF2933E
MLKHTPRDSELQHQQVYCLLSRQDIATRAMYLRSRLREMAIAFAGTTAIIIIAILFTTQPGFAEERFRLEQVADRLDIIWGIDFISENLMIFTEKSGSVSLLDLQSREITKISQAPDVFASGQGGLLDLAVSPDFQDTKEIFFTYSKRVERNGVTVLAKARFQDNSLILWQDILVTNSGTSTSRHYGSRIAFDQSGHLFFTVGDRGERPNAQNLSNHAGSVLRLKLDGSIPDSNPFIDTPEALPEIYSYGHRNPQGIAFDAETSRLWLIEHGPRGGDEINLIEAGKNYGWPIVSHGQEYYAPIPVGEAREKQGMEPPVKVYIPSIAPGSLIIYSGKAFPKWRGNLFAGALKLRHLNRVTMNAQGEAVLEERLFESLHERIRDVAESPAGLIYFSTDSGKIFRISP